MDTSKFNGKVVDARKASEHKLTDQEADLIYKQGTKIYEFLKQKFKDDYIDFSTTPVKTKEDLIKLGFEFIKNVARDLDEVMPTFYHTFLKPVMKSIDNEDMVYTYIGNLYITPLVMKIVDEYYDTYMAIKN